MPDYTLEFLGRLLVDMRDEMRELRSDIDATRSEMRERFDAIDSTINRHQDELTVTTAMVMRHASEPIAWGAMERQIKRLTERLDALEKT